MIKNTSSRVQDNFHFDRKYDHYIDLVIFIYLSPKLYGFTISDKYLGMDTVVSIFFQIQFVITFTHSTTMFFSGCDFPVWGKILLIGYMVSMVILFSNFYFQAYLRKARQRKEKTHTNGTTKCVGNGVVPKELNHVTNGKNGINGHIPPIDGKKVK